MLEQFRNHLSRNFTFLQQKKLLLATSGGIDSMVMADLLMRADFDIAIAHCNFNLRGGESDRDQDFVMQYATRNNIQAYTENFNTEAFAKDNKLSLQVAARHLRYAWFEELVEKHHFDFVLTAHHADDSFETFLINLSRGTGLDGLMGIPSRNGNIIRPMLPFSRDQIVNYARENNIEWREDSSNSSDKYLRNRIRHELVPIFKDINQSFSESFLSTLSHLQQAQSMVEDASVLVYKQVAIEKNDRVEFKISELKRLENFCAYLRHWLKDFGFHAWDDIYDLADAQSGKQIFGDGFSLLKDRELLILSPIDSAVQASYLIDESVNRIQHPISMTFVKTDNFVHASNDCIFADADLLRFPMQLRKWVDGDYFYPYGMKGKKKVSKFFKDEKFTLFDKSNAWLLTSGNEIVWIVGKRFDDRFKVTNETKNILKITTP